jgi:hypothetical protein
MKTLSSSLRSCLLPAIALLCLPAAAQDLQFAIVMKGQEFHQTSADIVSLGEWQLWYQSNEVQNEGEHLEPVHVFQGFAVGAAPDSLVSGSLTIPGGQVVPLEKDIDDGDTEIGIDVGVESPLQLDTHWPDGAYTLQLQRKNEGPVSLSLNLTGSAYPPVPQVVNFTTLQSASASANITVQWSPMGGTATDFIYFQVSEIDGDVLYESPLPGSPGALNGTSTQAVIPAGTLSPGRDYRGEVVFLKTSDLKTSPAPALAGYYKLTGFLIHTAPAASTPFGAEFVRAVPQSDFRVPRDTVVSFRFTHPMSTNPAHRSITWKNNDANFSPTVVYHWIENNTVLLCHFTSNLPADRKIGWTLNLGSFRDAAGFTLSGTESGQFYTFPDSPFSPPDVDSATLVKTRYYVQNGATPVPDGRYEMLAEIETNAPQRLKSATLTSLTGNRVAIYHSDPWDGQEYETPGEFGSKTDLDRFFPNGAYRMDFDGVASGVFSVQVTLGATDAYPPAPTVSNLTELQAAHPAQDITIRWTALSGFTNDEEDLAIGDGLIDLTIIDELGRDVFSSWGNGGTTANSQVIPAGTLEPGASYTVELSFIRVADVYGGTLPIFAAAGFESFSTFTITTSGQRIVPSLAVTRSGNNAIVTGTGIKPATSYALDLSDNLTRWVPFERLWTPESNYIYQFTDTDAQYIKARFYRLREIDDSVIVQRPYSMHGTVWTDSTQSTPLAGAVVGTSLDGATTKTDASGNFFLLTDTPIANQSYSVIITSGTQSRTYGPWNWGGQPRNQVFVFN